MLYVRVTLRSGEQVVSEFSRLRGISRYSQQVMGGVKPFNVWQVVAETHPVSGEPCLMRSRRLINGREIVDMQIVEPQTERADEARATLRADLFDPVTEPQGGEAGIWVAPDNEDRPELAVAGARYPVHVNPSTLDRYVILRAGDEPVTHIIHEGRPQRIEDDAAIPGVTNYPHADEGYDEDDV